MRLVVMGAAAGLVGLAMLPLLPEEELLPAAKAWRPLPMTTAIPIAIEEPDMPAACVVALRFVGDCIREPQTLTAESCDGALEMLTDCVWMRQRR